MLRKELDMGSVIGFVRLYQALKKALSSFILVSFLRRLRMSVLVVAVIFSISACTKEKPNAEFVTTFGNKGTGNGQFRYVEDFAFDKDGKILITDAINSNVQVFKSDGTFLKAFGG